MHRYLTEHKFQSKNYFTFISSVTKSRVTSDWFITLGPGLFGNYSSKAQLPQINLNVIFRLDSFFSNCCFAQTLSTEEQEGIIFTLSSAPIHLNEPIKNIIDDPNLKRYSTPVVAWSLIFYEKHLIK